MVDEVIDGIEAKGGDAREKLERLFDLASSRRMRRLLGIDLAVRDWARRDGSVAGRLRRADNRRMGYMRSLFGELCGDAEEAEVRCLLAFSLFLGPHFIAADDGELPRGEVLGLALGRLVA
jgi:hypothetical protein